MLCSGASCSRNAVPGTTGSESAEVVLADVGGERLTSSEFAAELARRSRGFPGGASPERCAALLEEMIRMKAALARARASGLENQPETRALMDKLLAARWLEAEFASRTNTAPTVSDAEVAAYYASNPQPFRLPPSVRAGVITFKIGGHVEPDRRAALREKAEAVRAEAATLDDAGFTQLVRVHSEDQATRYTGGDTGWLREGESDPRCRPEVIEAAFALKAQGDVAPLVAASNAYYVVRLSARREASVRPLSEVREAIRYQLEQHRRREQEETFFADLKRGLDIHVNESVFRSLTSTPATFTAAPPSLPGG